MIDHLLNDALSGALFSHTFVHTPSFKMQALSNQKMHKSGNLFHEGESRIQIIITSTMP
jgi:hypothetical protein